MHRRFAIAAVTIVLAGCAHAQHGTAPAPRTLAATLRDAQGNTVGTATLEDDQGAVRVSLGAGGLTPGEHGVHVHARGACTAPDFASAGGHYNPGGRAHGANNPNGPHAGDLGNLTAGADGRGRLDLRTAQLTLQGAGALLADSAAIVIHAGPDDQVSDPAGNAGARIACGVLTAASGRRGSE